VLVTGGTGFTGSRLCEVAALTEAFEPRVFVHSTGSAARIMRFPLDFAMGDLCDQKSVEQAMRGCDAVVHLARGDQPVMRKGLENILRAAVENGVSRFVHLSSVAVYGDNPPPESVSETAPARRTELAYGNEKLEQERRVLRYFRKRQLPVVILRPPNIYGPFAWFTLNLLDRIRSNRMAIVDNGQNPCNLVYVDNLVEAILLALWRPEGVGQIFFVTDREPVSWEQCVNDNAALLGITVPRVATSALVGSSRQRIFYDSLRTIPQVLCSGELRSRLREIPAFKAVESSVYQRFESLSEQTKQRIRFLVNGPTIIGENGSRVSSSNADEPLIASQRRVVAHSSDKARRLLGYSAPISYREGMAITEVWLRYARII
jgi:nucleoside-diphosphate-sugar epimerase